MGARRGRYIACVCVCVCARARVCVRVVETGGIVKKIDFSSSQTVEAGEEDLLRNGKPTYTVGYYGFRYVGGADDGYWCFKDVMHAGGGTCFYMPRDGKQELRGDFPPVGIWIRGRPWDRSVTAGGPQFIVEKN